MLSAFSFLYIKYIYFFPLALVPRIRVCSPVLQTRIAKGHSVHNAFVAYYEDDGTHVFITLKQYSLCESN